MAYPANEQVEIGAPTTGRSGRFLNDQRLRRHNFAIRSHPRKGQATWERQGKVFTQEEALALAAEEFRALSTK